MSKDEDENWEGQLFEANQALGAEVVVLRRALTIMVQTGGRCGATYAGWTCCQPTVSHRRMHEGVGGAGWTDGVRGATPSPWDADKEAAALVATVREAVYN